MTYADQTHTSPAATTRFWDRKAEGYAKRPVADEASYQEKLRITRQYLSPEMEVMEFGCGTGSTALIHGPYVRSILATDISANMLEIARNKASAAGIDNVTFQQASLSDLAEHKGRFGVVLGMSILHLLEDRDRAVAEVYGVLKPGGVFVSSTACIGDHMGFFKPIAWLGRVLGLLPILRIFKTSDLLASLQSAGFEIEHTWQPGKYKSVFIIARKPG